MNVTMIPRLDIVVMMITHAESIGCSGNDSQPVLVAFGVSHSLHVLQCF